MAWAVVGWAVVCWAVVERAVVAWAVLAWAVVGWAVVARDRIRAAVTDDGGHVVTHVREPLRQRRVSIGDPPRRRTIGGERVVEVRR